MSQGPGQWGERRDHEPIAATGPAEGPSSAATPSRPGSGIIRPMPTEEDGPSFETLAMKSVLSRARDNSRFDVPEAAADDAGTRRPLPIRALLLLTVGILVVGVLSGALWVSFFREVPVDDDTIVGVSESARAEVRTPQQTVRGYLDALAAGDIKEALTFGLEPAGPGSKALLTPAAYGQMPPESRPSNIQLVTDDPLATEIKVTYTLAGEQVETSMRVTLVETGFYRMTRTTVTIQLQVVGGDNLPTFVNGVAVENRSLLEVVPGTYTPSTGLPFVEFPASTSTVSILSLAYTETAVFPVNPELTTAGQSALLEAARASLARCVASTELTPTGCPNAIGTRKPVVPGSVKWSLLKDSDPWKVFKPALSSADQTKAVATVPLRLRVTMDYTDGRNSGNNDLIRNVAVTATMLGRDASSVTVSWEG